MIIIKIQFINRERKKVCHHHQQQQHCCWSYLLIKLLTKSSSSSSLAFGIGHAFFFCYFLRIFDMIIINSQLEHDHITAAAGLFFFNWIDDDHNHENHARWMNEWMCGKKIKISKTTATNNEPKKKISLINLIIWFILSSNWDLSSMIILVDHWKKQKLFFCFVLSSLALCHSTSCVHLFEENKMIEQ